VATVYEETEGNPFFVVEVFEYLAGSGRLFDGAGLWRRNLGVDEMDVPQGLRLVIGRRVERLSAECARVMRLAAVVGKTPEYELLRNIAALDDESLIACLDEAERAQMLVLDRGGGLSFAHELIRQALYGDLNVLRRQRLHLRIANAMEELYAPSIHAHVGALATHYRLAGSAANPSKAIDYSVKAGEAAAAVYGWREAETHWEAARELMERTGVGMSELAKHLARLAMLNRRSRLHGESRFPYGERAITLLQESGDAAAAAKLHVMLADEYSYWETMNVEKALSHASAAEDGLDTTDRGDLALLFTAITRSANQTFRLAEAEAASLRALDLAVTLDKPEITAVVLRARAMVLSSLGRLRESYELQDEAYDIYDRLDLPEASEALFGRGVSDRMLDNLQHSAPRMQLELAKPRLAQSIPLHLYHMIYFATVHSGDLVEARRIWTGYLVGTPLGNALTEHWLTLYDGKWEQTRNLFVEGWERSLTTGDVLNQTNYALFLGRLEFDLGNNDEAERWLQLALERSADRHLLLEFDVRCQSAWLFAETGRPDEALEHLIRLREVVAQGEDWHGLGGRYELAEAAFAACEGRWQAADEHFKRAVDVSKSHVLPYQQAKILHAWGRALAAARRQPAAIAKLEAAIELYKEHGAGQPWIDLIEETKQRITGAKNATAREGIPAGLGSAFGLSPRQREVLGLIAQGKTNREMAEALVLSERTVQRHISDLYLKIDVRNRAEATSFALNRFA